jgi:hypothetical protein
MPHFLGESGESPWTRERRVRSRVDVCVGLRCLFMTEGRWPLVVGPARLIPVGRTADDDGGRLHLAREGPGTEVAGVAVVTLCGRHATSLGVGVDLDVLGADRDRLCRSCWRVVEGWLQPPTAADGEDEVLAWLVETVLRGGSAMIDDVPFGRVRPLRQRAARQIKAAIGGTVRTRDGLADDDPGVLRLGDRRQDRGPAAPGDARRNGQAMGQRGGSSARPARLATTVVTDRPTIGKISHTESGRRYRAPRARQNAGYRVGRTCVRAEPPGTPKHLRALAGVSVPFS